MSRNLLYQDDRITVINGTDVAIGGFIQLYDKELESETPEGDGLVLDWSQKFGIEINLTSTPNSKGVLQILFDYLTENVQKEITQ